MTCNLEHSCTTFEVPTLSLMSNESGHYVNMVYGEADVNKIKIRLVQQVFAVIRYSEERTKAEG